MLEVMLWMAAGLIAGRLFRLKNLQKIILAMTWLLLLFLGWEAGGDSNVVKALPSLGLDALILTAGGTAGSCILAWLLWKSLKDRENDGGNGGKGRSDGVMAGLSGSLVILGFFVAGILLGLAGFDLGEGLVHKLGYRSLCILMLLVGMSAGGNPELVSSLKSMNPRIVLLPVATVAGTYIGCVLVNIALGYRTTDVLAIGSGFGYYSLSSVLISGSRGAELGTLALISNNTRGVHPVVHAPAGEDGGSSRAHFCRRGHNGRHHSSGHHGLLRGEVCTGLDFPRIHSRFLGPVPRELLLLVRIRPDQCPRSSSSSGV